MGYLLDPPSSVKDANHFKTSLDNQIEVVRNERRQRYDNVPYGKTRFATYMAMYPEGHPYRYLTIGKHEDLAGASTEDVKNFFRTWYVPANATIAIVGDFDLEEGKKLVDKWFGKFPKSARPASVAVPAPKIKSKEVSVDDEFAKLRQIQFVWHSPANYAEGDAELDIVANALTREGPGRLYRALVYSNKAQSVFAGQSGSGFSGQFSITVTLKSDSNLDEIKQIVMAEIANVTKNPLDAKEISRVIVANESSAIRSLETQFGRSSVLQQYNHYLGDPNKITWDLDRYRNTNAQKIRDTAATYLGKDNVLTVITNPVKPHSSRRTSCMSADDPPAQVAPMRLNELIMAVAPISVVCFWPSASYQLSSPEASLTIISTGFR
jgi:zinc protease